MLSGCTCPTFSLSSHLSLFIFSLPLTRSHPSSFSYLLLFLSLSLSVAHSKMWMGKSPFLKIQKNTCCDWSFLSQPCAVASLRLGSVKSAGSQYHAVCLGAMALVLLMNECTGKKRGKKESSDSGMQRRRQRQSASSGSLLHCAQGQSKSN